MAEKQALQLPRIVRDPKKITCSGTAGSKAKDTHAKWDCEIETRDGRKTAVKSASKLDMLFPVSVRIHGDELRRPEFFLFMNKKAECMITETEPGIEHDPGSVEIWCKNE